MTGSAVRVAVVLALLAISGCRDDGERAARDAGAAVAFDEDIQPLLADRCFACHGPDANKRQANLRLDVRDSALAARDGVRAIVPGDTAQSELVRRIHSTDPEVRMPPPESKRSLSAAEIDLLTQWVEQGAEYREHWAYRPLTRPPLPAVRDEPWAYNAIDRFVLAGLERRGLTPAADAPAATLARRLRFDITGLPPTPQEVDGFAAQRYAAFVDHLLAQPAYGERMAMYWLDLVRFADTNGYNEDQHHNIFPYRDYVIGAFNEGMPFDQFTIEQIAGDLLPQPTTSQRIATGYNRLNKVSTENGSQPKEFAATYAADRVRTTATVWMGATLGCAECHDHKFDPYTTRDFYSFAAFFADIEEEAVPSLGRVAMPPEVPIPTAAGEKQLAELAAQISRARSELNAVQRRTAGALERGRAAWERSAPRPSTHVLSAAPPFAATEWQIADGVTAAPDGSLQLIRRTDAGARRIARRFATEPGDLEFSLDLASIGFPQSLTAYAEVAWSITAGDGRKGFVIRLAQSFGAELSLYAVHGSALDVRKAELGGAERIESLALGVVWDESRRSWSAAYGLNGAPATTPLPGGPLFEDSLGGPPGQWNEEVTATAFDLATLEKRADGAAAAPSDLELRVTRHAVHRHDPIVNPPPYIVALRAIPRGERRPEEARALADYSIALVPELAALRDELDAIELRKRVLERTFPSSLTTVATPRRRVTRILPRGNWLDESGEEVAPAVPAFLPQLPPGAFPNRLALARWLVKESRHVTARVFVNRLWKMFFGAGIVRTLDDFGSQGSRPSHPELLDWLAAELIDSDWDVKRLIRLIVSSHTYRQSSAERPELLDIDPENLLLARQSSFRLDAETIRDNALAVSGLLTPGVGGASVKPYQPDGYWEGVSQAIPGSAASRWLAAKGKQQYRRGLYTYWKRTFVHPMLLAFDAPTREECIAERARSNTPLQSLVLLNDPTFVEAARVLAERSTREGGAGPVARIGWAYRQALSRAPEAGALDVLTALYDKHLGEFSADPEAARALTSVGGATPPDGGAAVEVAALTSVCRAVLNLHETITRY